MAMLTGANAILYMRKLVQDTSTTNPGLADADYLDLLNEQLRLWKSLYGDRVQLVTATTLIGGTWDTTQYNKTTVAAYEDILRLFITTAGTGATDTTGGTPLERIELGRCLGLQVALAAGTPSKFALQRAQTSTAADIGKFIIHIAPLPSANNNYIYGLVKAYHTDVTTGTIPDVSEEGERYCMRLASAQAAQLLGRDPAWMQGLLQPIPEETRAAMGVYARITKPRPRPGEEAA